MGYKLKELGVKPKHFSALTIRGNWVKIVEPHKHTLPTSDSDMKPVMEKVNDFFEKKGLLQ
jgi:hypothetical protein